MNLIDSVQSKLLVECVNAFIRNMERTTTFAVAPAKIAFMVRRDQLMFDNAIFKITGKGDIKLEDFLKDAPEGVQEEASKQAEEFFSQSEGRIKELTGHFGINYIEAVLDAESRSSEAGTGMQESIDALFGSVVLGSWTAFECLAADLWVIAVNNGPKEFRQKVQRSQHIKKRADSTSKMTPESELDPVSDYAGFLREERFVNFQTLPNIEKFYSILFDKKTITYLFESEPYISALAAVRNILAHKGGIADRTFESQAKEFPEFNKYKDGEELKLDGSCVKRLNMAALVTGVVLITHIDGILPNDTPTPP